MRMEKKDEWYPAFECGWIEFNFSLAFEEIRVEVSLPFPLQSDGITAFGCQLYEKKYCMFYFSRLVMTWQKSTRALVGTENISFWWGMMYLLPTWKKWTRITSGNVSLLVATRTNQPISRPSCRERLWILGQLVPFGDHTADRHVRGPSAG